MITEGHERFLRSIAERIDPARVEEVHLFPAIRQGSRESGVAVLTVRPDLLAGSDAGADDLAADDPGADGPDADGPGAEDGIVRGMEAEAPSDALSGPPRAPSRFTVVQIGRAHV